MLGGRIGWVLVAGLVASGWSPGAAAQTFFLGDEAALKGGAVTASVNDSSAIIYNPAGLAAAPEKRLDVSASGFLARFRPVPNLVTLVDGDEEASANSNSFSIASAPTALGYVFRLHPNWTLAAALFAPESDSETTRLDVVTGTGVNFEDDPTGLDGAEVALDVSAVKYSYEGTLGLAYRVNERLRIGVSGAAIYGDSRELRTFSGSIVRPGQTPVLEANALRSELSFVAARGGIGFQWDVHPKITLGGVAWTPSFRLGNFSRDYQQVLQAGDGAGGYQNEQFGESAVGIVTDEPGHGSLGVALRLGNTVANIDFEVVGGREPLTDSLAGRGFTLRPELDLTFNVRAGAIHRVNDDVRIGAGFYTRFSSPESRVQLGSDIDYYGFTAGVILDKLLELARTEDDEAVTLSSSIGLRYAIGMADTDTIVIDVTDGTGTVAGEPRSESSLFHQIGLHLGTAVRWR